MFARLLMVPFVLLALAGLYLSWEVSSSFTWMIVAGVVPAAILHIFSPQVNWWWWQRHPPDVDPPIREILSKTDWYYMELGPAARIRFRQRVAMFMLGNEYMAQGWESVPEDIKAMIAAAAVKVRFREENPLFTNCEKIVVYPTAFPSPAYPEEWHVSEWFPEDGVLLFSARDLIQAQRNPKTMLDVALYEYLRVQRDLLQEVRDPEPEDEVWQDIERLTGWTPEAVRQMIGLKNVDVHAIRRALEFQPLFSV